MRMRAVLIALIAIAVAFAALSQLARGSHADDGCTAGGPLAIAVPGLSLAIGDAGVTVLAGAQVRRSPAASPSRQVAR
jgi:hypothetical protein